MRHPAGSTNIQPDVTSKAVRVVLRPPQQRNSLQSQMHPVPGFYQSSAQFKVGTITHCFDNPSPMLPFVLDSQSQIRKTVENVVYRKGTLPPHTGELPETATYFKFLAFHSNFLFLFFFFTSLSTTRPVLTLLATSSRNTKGHSTSSCFSS